MTLSDADLERGLRDLGARTDPLPPPAPELVQTVHDRHRRQRRTRIQLAAVGLAAALLFVGVPVIASTFDNRRAEPAHRPQASESQAEGILFDEPTRGSLAGDEEWLAGIAALPIPLDRLDPSPRDPTVDVRRTAFAGDVVDGRVALVLLRLADGSYVQAWFTGPWKAGPEQMALGEVAVAERSGALALADVQTPGLSPVVLTVVAFPGDEVQVRTSRTVSASGETRDRWVTLPTVDGAGAMTVDAQPGWFFGQDAVRISRDGERGDAVPTRLTDRAKSAPLPRILVADPRALLDLADEGHLDGAVYEFAGRFGSTLDQARLTLLAAGTLPGTQVHTLLVGATFSSGATVALAQTIYRDRGEPPEFAPRNVSWTEIAPAGTPVIDRVFAAVAGQAVVVSGPMRGASAEIYGINSTLIATVPLVDGAGVGPAPTREPRFVRILDTAGAPVVEAEVTDAG